MLIALYLVAGMFAGTLSGLLGIGGGLVVVPTLVWLFKTKHLFVNDVIMPVAVGTSLAIMIFTASSSAHAYYKRGLISWPLVLRFLPGLCAGMVFGSVIISKISSDSLLIIFSIFLCCLAGYLFFYKQNIKSVTEDKITLHEYDLIFSLTRQISLVVVSICVGILSTIFGIGGGILMVPFFMFIGFNIREASGCSAICGVPIAMLGTILLTIVGLNEEQAMKVGTLGFIYWPAVVVVASSSMVFAPIGTRLSLHFKPSSLKRLLSVILILTAINIILELK
ncbi:MAG: sulfite exporter TauE/SafE family protein [Legionellaceae bacterium]|nr:sulfite exporter TauE/SafE family protein [Legionellaceae bacterium]